MVIFENSETKIEIKNTYIDYSFIIRHGKIIFNLIIDVKSIISTVNSSNMKKIRITGEDEKYFIVSFYLDRVEFNTRFFCFEIYLTQNEIKEIQENLEEFARDFWRGK